MKSIMENLYSLQQLELPRGPMSEGTKAQIQNLRETIPAPILAHADRRFATGKSAVAKVVAGVCRGCHIRLPAGSLLELRRDQDIQLCGNCGRYLLLVPSDPPPPPERETRPTSRKRSKRTSSAVE